MDDCKKQIYIFLAMLCYTCQPPVAPLPMEERVALPAWVETIPHQLRNHSTQSLSEWMNIFVQQLPLDTSFSDYPLQHYFCFHSVSLPNQTHQLPFHISYYTAQDWQNLWNFNHAIISTTLHLFKKRFPLLIRFVQRQFFEPQRDWYTPFLNHLFAEVSLSLAHQWNQSPAIIWETVPTSSQSLALMLVDLDADPTLLRDFTDIQDLSRSLLKTPLHAKSRSPFTHWSLLNIHSSTRELAPSIGGKGIILGGKVGGILPHGWSINNDYTQFFVSPSIRGQYAGYDGPCIAGHDRKTHRILLVMFSLDKKIAYNEQITTSWQALQTFQGHIKAYTWKVWHASSIYGAIHSFK